MNKVTYIFLSIFFLPKNTKRYQGAVMTTLFKIVWCARGDLNPTIAPILNIASLKPIFTNLNRQISYLNNRYQLLRNAFCDTAKVPLNIKILSTIFLPRGCRILYASFIYTHIIFINLNFLRSIFNTSLCKRINICIKIQTHGGLSGAMV